MTWILVQMVMPFRDVQRLSLWIIPNAALRAAVV